mgnify:CR=1 FL=1
MSDEGNIQFIYASTATFGDGKIETPSTQLVVFDIVRKSRRDNPSRWGGVVGALLFGDGYFLQVLEGDAQNLDELSKVIFRDERHRDPRVLRRQPIDATRFAQWSMKFPSMSKDLRRALGLGGLGKFNPYKLSETKLDTLVDHLAANEDSVV